MANSEERKKQIMDHINRSIKLPQQLSSTSSSERKQQIMDHIKRSRG